MRWALPWLDGLMTLLFLAAIAGVLSTIGFGIVLVLMLTMTPNDPMVSIANFALCSSLGVFAFSFPLAVLLGYGAERIRRGGDRG